MAVKFHLLKFGLAFVLSFIGLKMLLPLLAEGSIMLMGQNSDSAFSNFLHHYVNHDFDQAVINLSLAVVIGALILSIVFSLVFPKAEETATEE